MKNIFSPKLYLQGLRKVRTLGIAMAIVMIALNAWLPLMHINDGNMWVQTVEAGEFAPFGMLILIFAPLLVYNMFSYLNERKSSDFFHSLPQKRICVYTSFMVAIFTWIVSVLLVSTAVNSILWSVAKNYTVSVSTVVLTTLGFLILAFVMAGFMALAMMLTGTTVANFLVFLLFFLFIRAFGLFFLYGLEEIAPMFNPMHSWLKIFDWDFFLPIALFARIEDSMSTEASFGNTLLLLYWLLVGAVLFVSSGFAYCLRKSESATKSAPNKIMQNIYRIGVTFPFLMLGAFLLIAEKDSHLYLLCFVVAFLVWIIFELLTTKKIKNVLRSLPLFLIPVLLAGGYVASLHGTKGLIYATTPKSDDIESVKINLHRRTSHFTIVNDGIMENSFIDAVLAATEITDQETIKLVLEAIEDTKESEDWTWEQRVQNGYTYSSTVTVRLYSGRKVTYNLRTCLDLYTEFQNTEDIRETILNNAFSNKDIKRIYVSGFDDVKRAELWETLQKDFEALSDEEKIKYLKMIKAYDPNLNIEVSGIFEGVSFTQVYYLYPEYTPETIRLWRQFYENGTKRTLEDLRWLQDMISKYEKEDVSFVYMEILDYLSAEKLRLYTQDMDVIRDFLLSVSADAHLTDYQNAKNIYQMIVSVEQQDKEAQKTDDIVRTLLLTFSDEDLRMYEEILAHYAK
ncbi:MAG: hypothetical protein IJA86_09030 [Clostridia bacterium]|nr:hypothetical protein [Clostridia bacterium]